MLQDPGVAPILELPMASFRRLSKLLQDLCNCWGPETTRNNQKQLQTIQKLKMAPGWSQDGPERIILACIAMAICVFVGHRAALLCSHYRRWPASRPTDRRPTNPTNCRSWSCPWATAQAHRKNANLPPNCRHWPAMILFLHPSVLCRDWPAIVLLSWRCGLYVT
jgi:hypothetical protein